MGKSRSATILLAYLLWSSRQRPESDESSDMVSLPPKPLSVIEALELLRQGRPIAEPNEGFMDQLHLYEDMACPTTEQELKSHKLYRRWMNQRKVEESVRTLQAPDMEHIKFEDESEEEEEGKHMEEVAPGVSAPTGTDEAKALSHPSLQSLPQVTIKCRKCRHVIATTPFIIEHRPPPHRDPNEQQPPHLEGTPLPPPQCAHIFLHPLSWMREVLSEGKMEGRLACPSQKCRANIGKFAWTGLRCSCGGWVTPGFGINRTKIDEQVDRRSQVDGQQSNSGRTADEALAPSSTAGLRFPPGLKRQGNL